MDQSQVNKWNVPVLHDAIRAAVFSTRFGRNRALSGQPPSIEIMNTSEQFMNAFGVLERVVLLGADVDARDSFGNPALARAALDARQVVDEPLLPELGIDLQRILRLLLEAGGDPDWINPRTEQTLVESFRDDPFGPVLVTALGDR